MSDYVQITLLLASNFDLFEFYLRVFDLMDLALFVIFRFHAIILMRVGQLEGAKWEVKVMLCFPIIFSTNSVL